MSIPPITLKPLNTGAPDKLDPEAQKELNKYLSEPLESLASGIRASHQEIAQSKGKIAAVRDHARESACSAGFQFLAAKSRLDHGEFGDWVAKSGVSWDTANLYMGLSSNYERVRNLPSGTSLRKAYIAVGIRNPLGAQKDPAKQMRLEFKKFKLKLRDLPKKAGITERKSLAIAVRALQAECCKVALKLEFSNPPPRLRLLPKACLSSQPTELGRDQADNLIALELVGVFRAS